MKMETKHIYNEPGFAQQALCALIGSLWGPVAGAFSGYGSVALPSFDADPDAPFVMDEEKKAFFTSVPFLSAIIGSLIAGHVTARFGRRNVLTFLLLPLAASWLMIAFGTNNETFVAARLLTGLCAGMVMPIGQVYLTEIAAPGTRGFIASSTMFFQLFYGCLNYAVGSVVSWKYLAIVNAAIHLAHVPIAFFIPESPTWLITRGGEEREAKAREAFRFLRGKQSESSPLDEPEVEAEFADFRDQVLKSLSDRGTLKDILKWNYLKPVVILCIFVALRQFTGAFAVISYTVDIFKSAGGDLSPNVSTIIVGVVQVVFNMLSNSITDKIGRKRLIVSSGFAMGAAQTVFGAYYYFHTHPQYSTLAKELAWIPLVALIIFSIGFAVGFASALFVLMSELIPMKIKAHAAGLASIFNHVTNFLVVELYFRMKHHMTEAGTFWFYGGVCFLAAVYCLFLVPETNGKSLQELEEKLTRKKKPKLKSPETSPARCSCGGVIQALPPVLVVGNKALDFDNPAYILTVAVPSEVEDGHGDCRHLASRFPSICPA